MRNGYSIYHLLNLKSIKRYENVKGNSKLLFVCTFFFFLICNNHCQECISGKPKSLYYYLILSRLFKPNSAFF